MRGEIIVLYPPLDNRHSCWSVLVCVFVCVCAAMLKHTRVCISPGGNFDLMPSIQKNNMLWVGACCLLSFFSPSLLGPHLDESLYIPL